MNTSCAKCIFADFADSDNPCQMNIIEQIKEYHNINIKDRFNYIQDYHCKYAFSMEVYEEHKHSLGQISDLESSVKDNAKIKYYLMINVTDPTILDLVCDSIKSLQIRPKYVSFLLEQNNSTDNIIELLSNKLNSICEWKIHNFLEKTPLDHKITTVLDTHAKINDTVFFWVNNDITHGSWSHDVSRIDNIVSIQQQKCNGLFRYLDSDDGLFLSFRIYLIVRSTLHNNIYEGLKLLENSKFIYYA